MTTELTPTLQALADTAARAEKARAEMIGSPVYQQAERAQAELCVAILKAAAAGASLSQLGRALGVNRDTARSRLRAARRTHDINPE